MKTSGLFLLLVITSLPVFLEGQTVSIPIIGCNCGPHSRYNLIVTLMDGRIVKTKSKLEYDDGLHVWYITDQSGIRETRIFPRETKQLNVTDYSNYTMVGIPMDTAWLFNTDTGKINTYATVPVYQTENIAGIRQGSDGPIIPATLPNLLPMLQNDKKAISIAEKGKLYRATRLFNIGNN